MAELEDARSYLQRFAISEGIRSLDVQKVELETIRSRAIMLLGLIATASAFLLGASLNSEQRGWRFYVPIAIGTVWFVLLLCMTIYIQLPISGWKSKVSPMVIVEDFADDGSPDAFRQLAGFYDKARADNEPKLVTRRTALELATVAAGLTIVTWIVLVWLVAT